MTATSLPTVRLFIGSSTEGKPYANAVFSELESSAIEPTVWDQDVFQPSSTTIESLDARSREFDCAVFVFTPDDIKLSRGIASAAPRDNLIFELGLFIGRLGRERVWFLVPEGSTLGLPSDLLGITQLHYRVRSDKNFRAGVRTSCERIRELAQSSCVHRLSSAGDVTFWHTIPDRQRDNLDLRTMITNCSDRVFVSGLALGYLALHCKREVEDALCRNVKVEIVIAPNTEESLLHYARYVPVIKENLAAAHKRYQLLAEEFAAKGVPPFALFGATIPMTHSIGLYDEAIFISEFCIDTESYRAPSFRVSPHTPSYEVFLSETRILLCESLPLLGPTKSNIVQSL